MAGRKIRESTPASALAFRDPEALRAWLRGNHQSAREQWVRLYKKGSGRPSITWPELVDQVLCFGWIDGVRQSIDEESYAIRITPRRPGSVWSAVNLARVSALQAAGLMEPAGLRVFQQRDPKKAEAYAAEREQVELAEPLAAEFRRYDRAWKFFEAQPPSYRKLAARWVMSAKRAETQKRRLEMLITDSDRGQRLGFS